MIIVFILIQTDLISLNTLNVRKLEVIEARLKASDFNFILSREKEISITTFEEQIHGCVIINSNII